jgi:hypothetical protein
MAIPLKPAPVTDEDRMEPVPRWAVGHVTDCSYCGLPFRIEATDKHKAGLFPAILSIMTKCPHCAYWSLVWWVGLR